MDKLALGAKAILQLEQQRENELQQLSQRYESLHKENLNKMKQAQKCHSYIGNLRKNIDLGHDYNVELSSILSDAQEQCKIIGGDMQLLNENSRDIDDTVMWIQESLQIHEEYHNLQAILNKKLDNVLEKVRRIKHETEEIHESFKNFTVESNNILQQNEENLITNQNSIKEINENIVSITEKNQTVLSKCKELEILVNNLQADILTTRESKEKLNTELINNKEEFEKTRTNLLENITKINNGIMEIESRKCDLEKNNNNLIEENLLIKQNEKKIDEENLSLAEEIKETENVISALKADTENTNTKYNSDHAEKNEILENIIHKKQLLDAEIININDVLNKRKEMLEIKNTKKLQLENDLKKQEENNESLINDISNTKLDINKIEEETANLTQNINEINQELTDIAIKDTTNEQEYNKQDESLSEQIEQTNDTNHCKLMKLKNDTEELITSHSLLLKNQSEILEVLQNENNKIKSEVIEIEADAKKVSKNVDDIQNEILIVSGKYNMMKKSNQTSRRQIMIERERVKTSSKPVIPPRKRAFDEGSNSSIEAISYQELRKKKLLRAMQKNKKQAK